MPQGTRLWYVGLERFRSYEIAELVLTGGHVVLVGQNGAGKTNLLEALSMLSPGRGLRQARLGEMLRRDGGGEHTSSPMCRTGWVVSASMSSGDDGRDKATKLGARLNTQGGEPYHREVRIDGVTARSPMSLLEYISFLWLTPGMDGLFVGPSSDRRRFLNRFVVALDTAYGTRLIAYEKAVRSRNRLLRDGCCDDSWLAGLEEQMAELGTLIAQARVETVRSLTRVIREIQEEGVCFPSVDLKLKGVLEDKILDDTFTSLPCVMDEYRGLLRRSRFEERSVGRTLRGPHLTDLQVMYSCKGVPASSSSTGEQKAMLITLILAQARLVAEGREQAPILLLDEVAAHLDEKRRHELFDLMDSIGGQCWMTGTEASVFKVMFGSTDFVMVDQSTLRLT